MIKYVLPYYRVFHIIPATSILVMLYSYQYEYKNLKRTSNKLLTMTETFSSEPVIRAYWLFVTSFCTTVYSGFGPAEFEIFFEKNLRKTPISKILYNIFQVSNFSWPIALNAVIFGMAGNYPASENSISTRMSNVHIGFLTLFLVLFLLKSLSFSALIYHCDPKLQKETGLSLKIFCNAVLLICCPIMGYCIIFECPEDTMLQDIFCVTEYIVMFTIMVFNAEVFRGFHLCENLKKSCD